MLLRTQLKLAGTFVAAFSVAVLGVCLHVNDQVQQSVRALDAADEVKREVSRLAILLMKLDGGGERVRIQARAAIGRVDAVLTDSETIIKTVVDQVALENLQALNQSVRVLVTRMLAASDEGSTGTTRTVRELVVAQLKGQVEVKAEEFLSAALALSDVAQAHIERTSSRSASLLIAGVLLESALLLAFLAYVSSRVLLPLARLENGAQVVANGHLTHRIVLRRSDEIGRVADAFDQMTESLQGQKARSARLAARVRTVVEHLAEGVALYDADDRLVLCNDAYRRMNADLAPAISPGATFETIIRHGAEARAALAGHEDAESFVRERLAQRRTCDKVIERHRPDGGVHLIRDVLTPSGEIVSCLSDVTELNLRAQRLEESNGALAVANSELEEFTYVVSHDLKAPLRGIRQVVEWLSEDLSEHMEPGVARNMQRLSERAGRLETLVSDLLHYARETRSRDSALDTDIAAMIAGIRDDLTLEGAITMIVPGEPMVVPVASTPLATVLRNLIDNAIHHHDREEIRVEITVRQDDGWLDISVLDDGPGIPAGREERIFKLFQTLTRENNAAGTGIGLSVAKRLVENHGGTIGVDSPLRDERGARFRVRWPLAVESQRMSRHAA